MREGRERGGKGERRGEGGKGEGRGEGGKGERRGEGGKGERGGVREGRERGEVREGRQREEREGRGRVRGGEGGKRGGKNEGAEDERSAANNSQECFCCSDSSAWQPNSLHNKQITLGRANSSPTLAVTSRPLPLNPPTQCRQLTATSSDE